MVDCKPYISIPLRVNTINSNSLKSGFQVTAVGMLAILERRMFVLPSVRLSVTVLLSGNNRWTDK